VNNPRWRLQSRRSLLACLPLCLSAVAAASASTRDGSLNEVVIEARRARLTEMRQEMIRLEDSFYARYNELNTRDDFDVHCAEETRAGSRLEKRFCKAVYESKAIEDESRGYLIYLQRESPGPGGSPNPGGRAAQPSQPPPTMGGPPVPAIVFIEAKRPEFRRNIAELTRSNPELMQLLKDRDQLQKRYDATRRKLFGNKAPPEDL
jgi:hypothetical protein